MPLFSVLNDVRIALAQPITEDATFIQFTETIPSYDPAVVYVARFDITPVGRFPEYMLITAFDLGTLTATVVRGYDGSTAKSHAFGAQVEIGAVTAAVLRDTWRMRGADTNVDRNAVPNDARLEGMVVYTADDGLHWRLNPAPWAGDATDWSPLSPFTQLLSVTPFHPVGDGVTDDWAALQAAVNATPAGATLHLAQNTVYAVNKAIDCRGKTIYIDAHNSTILINSGSFPDNAAINFGALLLGAPPVGTSPKTGTGPSNPGYTKVLEFTGTLTAGMSSFSYTHGAVTVGSYIAANFGANDEDATLADEAFIAKVIANSEGTVTLDTPLGYDINGTYHFFGGVVSLGDNSSIRNVGLDWNDAVIPNVQISFDWARNCRVENVFGRFCIAVGVTNCEMLVAEGIRGDLVTTTDSAGHVLSGWLNQGVRVSNVHVTAQEVTSVFFLEGGFRDADFNDVTFNSNATDAHWTIGLVHCPTSKCIRFNNLTVNAQANSQIVLVTGDHEELSIKGLRINRNIYQGDMREIDSGHISGVALGPLVTLRYSIPLSSRNGSNILQLAKGVLRRIWLKLPNHVTAVNFRFENAGPVVSSPVLNQWFAFFDGIFNQTWNYPAQAGVADCIVTDDGNAVGTDLIEVMVETFLCGQTWYGSQ